ncbi:MAG TPA: hypothetical protein VIK57_24210 [Streptosporangiaceae bacterium]
MSGTDFLDEATAELYGSDPEGFTERRASLAAAARAAGDRPAAKEIARLRKPTRSAWMVNQLVRADPGVTARLTGLGDELRAAAAALDGAKIRELSQARRRLIDSLIRQALQQAGEQAPSAALREDLTATFGAALADPRVARELAAGTLPRAVHRADFSAGIPGLTLVPSPADEGTPAAQDQDTADGTKATARPQAVKEPKAAARSRTVREPEGAAKTRSVRELKAAQTARAAKEAKAAEEARAAEAARAAEKARPARAAEKARAAQERRRAVAGAEQALAEASHAADQAAQAEREERDNVRALESQLDEARRRVTEARRKVRETQAAQQKARRALGRLTATPQDRG